MSHLLSNSIYVICIHEEYTVKYVFVSQFLLLKI